MSHLKPESYTNIGSVCYVTDKADGRNWAILNVQLLCNHENKARVVSSKVKICKLQWGKLLATMNGHLPLWK